MGKRPKSVPGDGPPQSDKDDLDRYPAWRLFIALNQLNAHLLNSGAFRSLADDRERVRRANTHFDNLCGQQAARKANALIARGKHKEASAKIFGRRTLPRDRTRLANEPQAYLQELRATLERGNECCARVRKEIRAGGAAALHSALTPGSAAKSIELGVKVEELESAHLALRLYLDNPSLVIEKDIRIFEDAGVWFEQAYRELGAVIELQGLEPKPEPSSTVPDKQVEPAPPSDEARYCLCVLRAVPLGEGLRAIELLKRVKKQHGLLIGESKFSSRVVPELHRFGVLNRRKGGVSYYWPERERKAYPFPL